MEIKKIIEKSFEYDSWYLEWILTLKLKTTKTKLIFEE